MGYIKIVIDEIIIPRIKALIKVKGNGVIGKLQKDVCDTFVEIPEKY